MVEISEEYLKDAYEVRKLSAYQIAEELETYPNKVRRALSHYKIQMRSPSEAQKNALHSGRHNHPTRGKKRSEEVKIKISEQMTKVWEKMTVAEKNRRIKMAVKQWKHMTEGEQEEFKRLASEAVRIAAVEGSKLEKSLLSILRDKGYQVEFHQENLLANEKLQIDILIPSLRIAIEVDGPAHFYPIWGNDNLAKHLLADNNKTGLLLQSGYVLIRVKHLTKTLSKSHERKVAKKVLETIDSIQLNFPPREKRLIEIEVK